MDRSGRVPFPVCVSILFKFSLLLCHMHILFKIIFFEKDMFQILEMAIEASIKK